MEMSAFMTPRPLYTPRMVSWSCLGVEREHVANWALATSSSDRKRPLGCKGPNFLVVVVRNSNPSGSRDLTTRRCKTLNHRLCCTAQRPSFPLLRTKQAKIQPICVSGSCTTLSVSTLPTCQRPIDLASTKPVSVAPQPRVLRTISCGLMMENQSIAPTPTLTSRAFPSVPETWMGYTF